MRRSPRNLNFACNHAGLTHFGGVYFLQQLRNFLARHLAYRRVNNRREAEQIVIALRDPGFPVEYRLAPGEGHGFARPVNNLALFMESEKFRAQAPGRKISRWRHGRGGFASE